MEKLNLTNVQLYNSVWLPFGRSNMEALNRFVGSHKKYTTPTEFGVQGSIDNMLKGSIQMKEHGVFLTPVDFDFTGFLKAKVKKNYEDKQEHGLSIYKNGLSVLGIELQNQIGIDSAKIMSGKLNQNFASLVLPLLTDIQKSILSGLYGEEKLELLSHKLHSYSLLKCELEKHQFESTDQIIEQFPNYIDAFTDWIISHHTIDGCHIFIGMAGCICIGKTNEKVESLLKYILYQQTCMKTAQRLHSLLWTIRRKIHNVRQDIRKSKYRLLKESSDVICELNDTLSKISVFDQLLQYETKDLYSEIQSLENNNHLSNELIKNYIYELEKSENREITVQQLNKELSVLSSELENKLELIMTKDNTQLNLILLILTVISVLGVAEANNFTQQQWGIVMIFLLPFSFFIFMYVRKLRKNYYFSIIERRNKSK